MKGKFSGLAASVGAQGSGAVRYAAAMQAYVEGQMPTDMLEIYRICSKFDAEDPIAIARFEGVAVPEVCTSAVRRERTQA